jgi:hypothetical protein
MEYPGMREGFKLRDVQTNAVWRILSSGKGLMAHEVGLGKTAALQAAAMELRRMGLAKKPCICVPKATLNQMVKEFEELYPGAKLFSSTGAFAKMERKKALNQIATGDYDAVILSYEHLDFMKMKPETQQKFIAKEMEELQEAILDAQKSKELDRGTVRNITKSLESRLKQLEQDLNEILKDQSKDDIYFEDSGIDFLMVDEAHNFKTLPVYHSGGNIKGIPTGRSQRATSMAMRTKWLLENNNNRGVVFATGTPIANTIAELYNMQRYIQPDTLEATNNIKFDSWKATFGKDSERAEFNAAGQIKTSKRFSEFINLPELRHLTGEVMDVAKVDDMLMRDTSGNLVLDENGEPKKAVTRPKKRQTVVACEQSKAVDRFMDGLKERALACKGKRPMKGEDGMMQITTDAKMAALDLRLVDSLAEDDPNSKVNQAVKKIIDVYHGKPGKTQAIFSEIGIHPNKETGFSVFADVQKKLIAAGIPKEEIFNFSPTRSLSDKRRNQAKAAMRKGQIRIAFGSTKTLGTGTNVQDHLATIHHLDIPWVPADEEQREGRGYRQGNKSTELEIVRYLQKGSADNFLLQTQARKRQFIQQYLSGSSARTMREIDTEELSPDELISIATDDPDITERFQLTDEVKAMERQELRHKARQERFSIEARQFPERKAALETKIKNHKTDIRHLEDNKDFRLDMEGRAYLERNDAKPALALKITQAMSDFSNPSYGYRFRSQPQKIGDYRGMEVHILPNGFAQLTGPSGETYEAKATLEGIESAARRITHQQERKEAKLRALEIDHEKMLENVGDWKRAEELKAKRERLAQLANRMEAIAMSLMPGQTQVVGGVTYILNRNHRWQRQQQEGQPNQSNPPTPSLPNERSEPNQSQPSLPNEPNEHPGATEPSPPPSPQVIQMAATEGDSPQHRQARQTVALHYLSNQATFYDHTTGKMAPLDPPRIHGMLDGIDVSKPVVLGPPPTIPPPMQMVQWQAKGGYRGSYFSQPGIKPEQIGIYSQAKAWSLPGQPVLPREETVFDPRNAKFDRVTYLHSTAAPTMDTWSIPGKSIPVTGGGPQWFIPVAAHPSVRIPKRNEQATASN